MKCENPDDYIVITETYVPPLYMRRFVDLLADRLGLMRVHETMLHQFGVSYDDHSRGVTVMAKGLTTFILTPQPDAKPFIIVHARFAQRVVDAVANQYEDVDEFLRLTDGVDYIMWKGPPELIRRREAYVEESPPEWLVSEVLSQPSGPGGRTPYTSEQRRKMVEQWFRVKAQGGTSLREFVEKQYPNITYHTFRTYITEYNKRKKAPNVIKKAGAARS